MSSGCAHKRVKRIYPLDAAEASGLVPGPKTPSWVVVASVLWCRDCGAHRLNYESGRWVSPRRRKPLITLQRVPDRQLQLLEEGVPRVDE